jgi:hypothetical protein
LAPEREFSHAHRPHVYPASPTATKSGVGGREFGSAPGWATRPGATSPDYELGRATRNSHRRGRVDGHRIFLGRVGHRRNRQQTCGRASQHRSRDSPHADLRGEVHAECRCAIKLGSSAKNLFQLAPQYDLSACRTEQNGSLFIRRVRDSPRRIDGTCMVLKSFDLRRNRAQRAQQRKQGRRLRHLFQ